MGALAVLPQLLPMLKPMLERLFPDPAERAKVEQEIEERRVESEARMLEAQSAVMTADAGSESWMTRNARPVTVLTCLAMMVYIVVFAPIFGVVEPTVKALEAVPTMLWAVIGGGIGLYQIARTLDKRRGGLF